MGLHRRVPKFHTRKVIRRNPFTIKMERYHINNIGSWHQWESQNEWNSLNGAMIQRYNEEGGLTVVEAARSDPESFNWTPFFAQVKFRPRGAQKPEVQKTGAELDAHQHPDSDEQQYYNPDPGRAFLNWIDPPSSDHG
ncbi:hypothetical protein BDC45DRAFT_535409 [Circinella umbellata]|nr:hypothetical protein BDC45DRAFT_535409 [Circinella umbellata]